jgi:hypothetical protein
LPDAIAGQDKKVQKYEHIAKEKDTGKSRREKNPPTQPERLKPSRSAGCGTTCEASRQPHLLPAQAARKIRFFACPAMKKKGPATISCSRPNM